MLREYGSCFFLSFLGSEPIVGIDNFLRLSSSVPRLDPNRERRFWYACVGSIYTRKSLVVEGSELRMMDMALSMMLLDSVSNLGNSDDCEYLRAVVYYIPIPNFINVTIQTSAEV